MEEKEQLLDASKLSEEDGDILQSERKSAFSLRSVLALRSQWLLLLLFVLTNCAWALTFVLINRPRVELPSPIYPPYGKVDVPFDHKVVFQKSEANNTKTSSDELWESLVPPGGGLVSLPKHIAQQQSLWPTPDDPYNEENSIYLLAGFHHIHCLTVIRDHIWHGKTHTKHQWSWPHITHCLDTIRQTLMCNIDTTLLGTTHQDLRVFGDGAQPHTCKDFWELKEWLKQKKYAYPLKLFPKGLKY